MNNKQVRKMFSILFVAFWIFGGMDFLTNFSIVKYSGVIGLIVFGGIMFLSKAVNNKNGNVIDGFTRDIVQKECPICHNQTDSNKEVCTSCGANTLRTLECDYCSHMNHSDAVKCENCMAALV